MDSATQALVSSLSAPGYTSKKYRMTVIGILASVLIFVLTAIGFIYNPASLLPLLGFAQAIATCIAGMVGAFSLGQAAVDYRTSASLANK